MGGEELSRRKVLAGIASAGGVGAVVGRGTTALFSDQETFTNNAIKASNNVAGVVDITVDVAVDDGDIVYEISLPEAKETDTGDTQDINNNPSHVWVRSDGCPDPAPGVKAEFLLQCNGSQQSVPETIQGPKKLSKLIPDLNEWILLSCGSKDTQDCLRPGETRKLKLELQGSPDRGTNFELKFFAQQCRYNTEPTISQPDSTTGPKSCSPSATNSCPIDAPSPTFPTLDISPSVPSPSFTVPSADCSNLAFDNANLPDKTTLDLSKGPAEVRSQLNSTSGIELTERVLSDNLASQHIEQMPDSPSTLTLGGDNPAARIGTKNDSKAVVDEKVKLKNDSTVVGAIETDGSFKLKGGSAVAGDVGAATVEAIKNSLLVGNLTTIATENTLPIKSGSLVCGEVDAAGPIQIKQARVNGRVTADGDIGEINESTVTGDVTTTGQGNVSVKSESLIDGNVDASGAISEVKGSEVTGPLEADGNISSVKQSTVGGDVTTTDGSNGTVTVEESTVDGSIDADGGVSAVKSDSEVIGDVTAGGDIPELKNSVVTGNVKTKSGSDGAITIEGAEIGGPVTADGKIEAIKSESAVGGDVTANGDISAIKGSQVDGDVRTTDGSNGTVKVKNSDIGGLIDADGNVEAIKSESKIAGDVTAGGNISALKSSDIGGNVTTTDGGDVTVEASTVVGGMDIDGTISKMKASDVGGNVEAADIASLKGAQISGDVTVTDGRESIAITKNNRKSVICGTVETSGRIEKIKNSRVTGSVRAAQVGKLKGEDTEVGGNVETTDSNAGLSIKGGSTVHGTVDAAGRISEINSSTVDGSIDADGRVEKIKSSDVGAVTADGNVTIKSSNTGKIVTTSDSGGDLVLESSSTVKGDIVLDGTAKKIKGSTVEGDVRASDVKKIKESTIEGTIEADGDVKKIKDSTVKGAIKTDGGVKKIKNATVEGTIEADGDVVLKGSTTVEGDVNATGTVSRDSGVTVMGTV